MDQILNRSWTPGRQPFSWRQRWRVRTLSFTHEQIAGHLGTIREVISSMPEAFETKAWWSGLGLRDTAGRRQLEALAHKHRR